MTNLVATIAWIQVLLLAGFMLLAMLSIFVVLAEWERPAVRNFAAYNCAATIGAICTIFVRESFAPLITAHIRIVEKLFSAVSLHSAIVLWRAFMYPAGALAEILLLGMGAGCLVLLLIRKFRRNSGCPSPH